MKLRAANGDEAVVGQSRGYWLRSDDFVTSEDGEVDALELGELGFPRDLPAAYGKSAALKSLIGKRGRIPAKRVAVAGLPGPEDRRQLAGLLPQALQSFSNAERAAAQHAGVSVVQGWAVFERLDRPQGTVFVAERYWWNALPDGQWVDLTPRPDAWSSLLLAEAAQGAPKSQQVLAQGDARLAARLLQQRFPGQAAPPSAPAPTPARESEPSQKAPEQRSGARAQPPPQRKAEPVSAAAAPQPAAAASPSPAASSAAIVRSDDGEWVGLLNTDSFPGQDAGRCRENGDTRKICRQQRCGGYVTWREVAYLRSQSTDELLAARQNQVGSTLWLPADGLKAASMRLSVISESLPEDIVPGARPVEKLSGLSMEEMCSRFENSQPVVLKDAQEGWPAQKKWTLDWLSEHYGDEEMQVSDLAPFFRHADKGRIQTVKVTIAEYIRYMKGEPSAVRALQKEDSQVFYGNGWTPFTTHHDLLQDVSDRLYCVVDRVPPGNNEFNRSLTKVFMGPAGTISRLHHDTYSTHVWLSQIRGRKQFIVYHPDDTKYLNAFDDDEAEGRTSLFDPTNPDPKKFPDAHKARAFSVVVEEGETVVLPSRWWHWAKSLTPSVTLMRNFINDSNWVDYQRVMQNVQESRELRKREMAGENPNGVRVEVQRAGDGVTYPQKGQTLTMNYIGRLASNDKVFDSSYERGEPLKFKIGHAKVIRGWDDGIMKMSLGEKSRLYVSPDYGYGGKGCDDAIPPDAALIFDVELLKIE